MKKIISVILLISIFTVSMSSCKKKEVSAPTCDEVIAAYEEAGYHIYHIENENQGEVYDELCYLKVWLDDEYDYVYFYFFENAEDAEAYAEIRQYNVFIYLFSVIYGDPSWLYTKTYDNIEYEYENSDLLKPFNKLIGN